MGQILLQRIARKINKFDCPNGLVVFVMILAFFMIFMPVRSSVAEDFSLFGITFGMSRPEVGTVWIQLDTDEYAIPNSRIEHVATLFDHQDKLYQLSFSLYFDLKVPPPILTKAFQDMIEKRWGRANPDTDFNISVLVDEYRLTIWNKKLREAYIRAIEESLSTYLKP